MGLFDPKKANQVTTTMPWKEQRPFLKYIWNQAKDLYQGPGPKYFEGSTVSPFSKNQLQAFGLGRDRALNGNAGLNAFGKFNTDVINGKYSGDPYQGKVFNSIQNKVAPSVNSLFSGAGRYGSGANQTQLASSLTDAFAPYASQMYQQGLDRRMQAGQNAFKLADEDYRNIGVLEQIGQKQQGQGQLEINDAKNRWDYYQNLPNQRLQQLQGFVNGNFGQTETTPTYQPSPFSQILGGGMGILGLLGGLL
jgi:hypothetical protein